MTSVGKLFLVSVGPGSAELIPPLAETALRESEAIIGYELYLTWIRSWIDGKEIHAPALTHERERASLAIEQARSGRVVSLVSSGDIGVYGMAALVLEEMAEEDRFELAVIPGISAATSGAPRRRSSSVATAPCTASTSRRPTRGATSTSWPGPAATPSPTPGSAYLVRASR